MKGNHFHPNPTQPKVTRRNRVARTSASPNASAGLLDEGGMKDDVAHTHFDMMSTCALQVSR